MELQLERILAAGTFGWVCVVHDRTSRRRLAAKVLREEHVQNPKAVARMRDEARLLSNLDHPNIVQVFGIEEFDGRPVLLLEYVEGAPFDELLATLPAGLPPAEAIEVARQTHGALHAAWRTPARDTGNPVRVIHRDIKPGNLMVSSQGQVKVLDFGIAHGEMAGKESITVSMVLGAPGYLAPERLDGEEDRIEGDVYAMGLVLHELLTGRFMKLSLQQKNHATRMDKHMHALEIPGADTWTRQAIVDLLRRMLAYEPDDRPDHAAVVQALTMILARAQWSPNLPSWSATYVSPIAATRSSLPAAAHPQYAQLRFIESKEQAGWLPWNW